MSTMVVNLNLSDVDTTQDDREAEWTRAMHGVEVSDLLEAVAEEIATTSEENPLSYEAESLLADLPDPDYGVLIRPSTAESVGRYVLSLLISRYAAKLEHNLARLGDIPF